MFSVTKEIYTLTQIPEMFFKGNWSGVLKIEPVKSYQAVISGPAVTALA